MSSRLLLSVFGATGNQGGSVINSVLAHPILSKKFRVRAVTRDPSTPAGQALTERGVEVVKADLGDKESLRHAIQGSHTVFAFTNVNIMEMTSTDAEFTQGKNIADLCAELGVKHVIISTVPNVLKESGGRYPNAMHWQVKAEIAEYMQSIGLPLTRFEPGSFTQNLKMIRKGEDGAYRLAWPIAAGAKIPYFDPARDTGKFIVPVLLDPKKWIGGRILGAAGWWSGTEIADLFNEVNPGSKLEYEEISEEEYAKSIPPGIVPMMLDQMRWIRDYAYFGENAVADVEESLKYLEEKPGGIKEYLEAEGAW